MRQFLVKTRLWLIGGLLIVVLLSSFNEIDNSKIFYDKLTSLGYKELHAKGHNYEKNESFDSAIVTYTFLVNKYKETGDIDVKRKVLDAYLGLGYIYYLLANPTQSFDYLQIGSKIADDIGDISLKAKLLNNISSTYYFMKEYDKSEIYLDSALNIISDTNDIVLRAGFLNNYGLIKKEKGEYEKGLEYIMQSYQLIVNDTSVNAYEKVLNIGECYLAMGKYDEALKYFRKISPDSKNVNSYWVAMAYKGKGDVCNSIKRYDSATYYYEKSKEIASIKKYDAILMEVYLKMSDIYHAKGDLESALKYYKIYNDKYTEIYDYDKFNKIKDLELLMQTSELDKNIRYLNTLSDFQNKQLSMQYKVIFILTATILIFVVMMVIVTRQKREIKNGYNDLVIKNLEIVKNEKIYEQRVDKLKQQINEQKADIDMIVNGALSGRNSSDRNFKDWVIEKLGEKYSVCSISSNITLPSLSDSDENNSSKYSSSWLTIEQKDVIKDKIVDFMQYSKQFLEDDFSIEVLAKIIGIHKNYISQTINECFGVNFNMFVNDYRIREARQMLSSTQYSNLTIEAIANMVGFKSKTSFNTHFKNVTGVTPSVYQKNLSKL